MHNYKFTVLPDGEFFCKFILHLLVFCGMIYVKNAIRQIYMLGVILNAKKTGY